MLLVRVKRGIYTIQNDTIDRGDTGGKFCIYRKNYTNICFIAQNQSTTQTSYINQTFYLLYYIGSDDAYIIMIILFIQLISEHFPKASHYTYNIIKC